MTPPPKTPARRQRGTSAHSRHRRPSQPNRLQLRPLFSSRRFMQTIFRAELPFGRDAENRPS
eukprot:5673935-Prymnesium_polylepis.1